MEKIAGTISEEDDQRIGEEISNNPAVKAQWETLRSTMESEAAQQFLDQLDADQSWNLVSAAILNRPASGKPRVFLAKRWLAAAAIILLMMSAGLYLFFNRQVSKPMPLALHENSTVPPADSLKQAVGALPGRDG